MRNDYLHKLSSYIIKHYDTICLEDLDIRKMLKNHNLSDSIHNVVWGEFVRQLTYKASWYSKNIIFIGKYEPSTKTCSKCDFVKTDITLNTREWTCPICGAHHDRDINAAINIKRFAINKTTDCKQTV